MPFRSLQTLEHWLGEFRQLGYPVDGLAAVMPQDGDDGENTGLVGVRLMNAATVIYIQPEAAGALRWVVTMEARDSAFALDAPALLKLAAELTMVSALCAFLEARSAAFVGRDAP